MIFSLYITSIGCIYAQSNTIFENAREQMGINTQELATKQTVSRYEVARLINAVECKDCIQVPTSMIQQYNNQFWTDFIQLPGKDFNDIPWNNAIYAGENYFYCTAYVGDNNYMRGYPKQTSPICAGLFCGARSTNKAEFIQIAVNILAKYIYQNYRANRSAIQQWVQSLPKNSYPDRYIDTNDRQIITQAAQQCSEGICTIQNDSQLKTYMKYCMFNIQACAMRTFGTIGEGYRPVAELNILYNQDIIDTQRARNIDIYSNIDGKTVGDILQKIYGNIQCNFDNDYDCDGIPNRQDNCPYHYNPSQTDTDADGIGDVCDDDIDGDGIKNPIGIIDETGRINIKLLADNKDNCIRQANPDQADSNNNNIGDACSQTEQSLGMYIAVNTIGSQAPLTTNIQAVTKGTIKGDIQWNMGDGSTKTGINISHTYTNPGIYGVSATAQGIKNTATAKTTIIVGQSSIQHRGLQIQTNTRTNNNSTDITFSSNTIGDIEYIQRDFGNNNRVNREPNQSITRQYTQTGNYTVIARAFKDNTLLAISRIHIGIGTQGSQLLSQDGLRINTNQSIRLQTNITNPSTIKQIQRDFGDGTTINNSNTIMTHKYTTMGSRVIMQTITRQDDSTMTNYITIYVDDPLYNQSFAKNFAPSELVSIPGQTIRYSHSTLGNPQITSSYIQRYTPTISTKYQNNNTVLNHRYDTPGVYFPSNIQYINQCLFLEAQATVVIEQQDICMEIIRTGRSKNYCDMDKDGIPDICDDDIDGDGVKNLIGLVLFDNPDCSIDQRNINRSIFTQHIQGICTLDNCPFQTNTNQEDLNRNGIGDVCETTINTLLTQYQQNRESENIQKDSDGDGIPDSEDACPTIPGGYGTMSGCPSIGIELLCPNYGTDQIQNNIGALPRCPINTRRCGDNSCQIACNDFGGELLCNNNNICDASESCNCPDCLGEQNSCQNGLMCGSNTNSNICITNPNPSIPTIATNNTTSNCSDPTKCIQIPTILATTCNQCPCQFADFTNDLLIGDKIRASLRDQTQTTLYRYTDNYTIR